MKYTKVKPDAFQKLVLNAGVLLTDFNPATGDYDPDVILGITTGGLSFNANPAFSDFGEDVDNCPPNTMQLKRVTNYDPTLSGTLLSVDAASTKILLGGADIDAENASHIIPRTSLTKEDFIDLWLVGDYSDYNKGNNAGYFAILLKNAFNTGGFQLQTTKDGKGQFSFDFHGHYDIDNIDEAPFELYVVAGKGPVVTLSALSITGVTLSPTFAAATTAYTATTTDDSNVITATATDTANATVTIKNGTATVTSGSAATWTNGENALTVTVTNGGESKTYTVTVTKDTE